ncbi:MAG: universal stress protein [Microlunatus sp.]
MSQSHTSIPPTTRPLHRSVIVGVTPHQPESVLRAAAWMAHGLDAELVCAYVDTSAYVVEEHADGTVESRPLDPDAQEWVSAQFDPALAGRIRQIADELGMSSVRTIQLAGEVARALSRLAEAIGAELIVVGTRSGVRASVKEYFGGSVAVHLAHRQHRPVVVVPLSARSEGPLPWEDEQ